MTFSRSNNIAGFESRGLLDPQLVLSLLYHVLPFWEMESQEWKGQPRRTEDCSFWDVLFLWTPDPWHVLDTAFRSQELGVGVWGRNHRFYLATNRIESRFRLMWKTNDGHWEPRGRPWAGKGSPSGSWGPAGTLVTAGRNLYRGEGIKYLSKQIEKKREWQVSTFLLG